jgi:hypothetical protein
VCRVPDLKNRAALTVNEKGIAWGRFGTRRVLVPWTQLRDIQIGQLDRSTGGSRRSAVGFGPVGLALVAATVAHKSKVTHVRYQVIRVHSRSGEYFDFATSKSRAAVATFLLPTSVALAVHSAKATRKPQAEVARSASVFSVADELEKLVKLRDSGVLSQEEFANQKVRLLAQ